MSDVSGTTTYGYDNRNRLTSKQAPCGTLSYTYDAASNPLVPSADIDIHLDLSATVQANQVCYSGSMTGDQFPDVEVFVVNKEDQAQMLLQFQTSGGRSFGVYRHLPGNGHGPMGSFSNQCAAQ